MESIDTIAAIATAVSNSGISIIRISGDDAVNIVQKCFLEKGRTGTLENAESHTIHYGYMINNEKVIDEVLVMVMKAPRSYTKEDVIEINCHGGRTVTKKVLETVLKCGARAALPGEFTKRAFLNGRIDLSQAEAVSDIISSKTDEALNNSISLLKGTLKNRIKEIREEILKDVAFIEAALDDPEHIDINGFSEILSVNINEYMTKINTLVKTYDEGKYLKEGIKVAIIGKPNVGKSSLLNLLLGEERAIVTDIEGTTRDSLEEEIILNGLYLKIIDTAGIRNTNNVIEKIGIERAIEISEKADLILYLIDTSVPLDENDQRIYEKIKNKKVIVLLNKSDLSQNEDVEVSIERLMPGFKDRAELIHTSTKSQTGIDKLKETIEKYFFAGEINSEQDIYITSCQQKDALLKAYEALENVKKAINDNMSEDFLSIDLMGAYEKLGEIIGETIDEDLINKIFSDFCMGK